MPRPNLLLFTPDQLRADVLDCFGSPVARTPAGGDVFGPGVTEASSDFSGFLEQPAPPPRTTPAYPHDHPIVRAFYFGSRGDALVVDSDEATIRTAERWLAEGAPRDQPWAMWVPPFFPHPPFTVEEPWFSLHDRDAMPDPVPVAGPGKPRFMAAYREAYAWDELAPDDVHEVIATYHGACWHGT